MMIRCKLKYILVIGLFGLLLVGCGSGGESSNDSHVGSSSSSASSSGDGQIPLRTSHRAGENCLSCHTTGGSAESDGVFYAAGTVYTSNGGVQTNATINLYLHGTNTRVAIIETDDSGNFYHSDQVEGLSTGNGQAVTGVDVEVVTPTGERNMPGLITNGGCNGCHYNGSGGNGRIIAN